MSPDLLSLLSPILPEQVYQLSALAHVMCKDADYAAIEQPPLNRLAWMLSKLNSDRRHGTEEFANKFISKVNAAFQSLPEQLDWQSYYMNDLRPYLKMDAEVKEVAIEKKLNKSQAKALQKLKDDAPEKTAS